MDRKGVILWKRLILWGIESTMFYSGVVCNVRQTGVEKVYGRLIHALMMQHNSDVSCLNGVLEFFGESVPALNRIGFVSGVQVNVDGDVR